VFAGDFRLADVVTFILCVRNAERKHTRIWTELAVQARKECGLISRERLTELRVPKHLLEEWVAKGRLVRVAPRVWMIAGSPDSWEQRLWRGVLSLGPGSCVSHSAAAQLHGFDRTPRDRVEFTVARDRRNVRLNDVVHSTAYLPGSDICKVRGIPTTSATRTVIDLARARVPRVRLEAAIDSAVREGLSAPVVLARRLAELRGPGRWGCRLVDELVIDAGGTTMLERRFLTLVREAGLPRPVTQRPYRDESTARTIARVDFVYEEFCIVIEVSGKKGHSSSSERARDAHRRGELTDIGFRVYEYTWEQVIHRSAYVKSTLTDRLRAGGWAA
jgi:hypothetical protein